MINQMITNDGNWKGSTTTAKMVAEEIGKRWGKAAVKKYDPLKNCFTFKKWQSLGYHIIKGEHGIRSVTFIRKVAVDDKTGKEAVLSSYPKTVILFYINQVEKNV